MQKAGFHIVLFFLSTLTHGQIGLLNNAGSQVTVNEGSTVTINGTLTNQGDFNGNGPSEITISNDLQNGGSLETGDQSNLTVEGQLSNTGSMNTGVSSSYFIGQSFLNSNQFFNTGLLVLGEDFNNTGTYNGVQGSLELNGPQAQLVNSNDSIGFVDLIMNGAEGIFNVPVGVSGSLDLINGIIRFDDPQNEIWILENAQVFGGSENSFVEARMVRVGTGFRNFPVGVNGTFALVELEDVMGTSPVYAIQAFEPLPSDATIDRTLQAVSPLRYWILDKISGEFMGSILRVRETPDLALEDLEPVQNAEAEFNKPVIAQSDTLEGDYRTMNDFETVESTVDGLIVSDSLLSSRFFAIGIGPTIPPDGVLFIPNTFSPLASDPEDQVVKVYAERIDETAEFSFRIFNRAGLMVFETNDFVEANTIGWSGMNSRTGEEVPGGNYTYTILLTFENGRTIDEIGSISYVR
ncbi:MAG: gliding motility-associated C-terminal domain-containing protein [Bacteroidota bacterium]